MLLLFIMLMNKEPVYLIINNMKLWNVLDLFDKTGYWLTWIFDKNLN